MSQQIPFLYVANSELHGQGVFTGREIEEGTIIEICPIIYLPEQDIALIKQTILNNYYFEWDDDLKAGALALGYGSIYNHSFRPNAYYKVDMQEYYESIAIYAFRNIHLGEEITINYNGDPLDLSPIWFETE